METKTNNHTPTPWFFEYGYIYAHDGTPDENRERIVWIAAGNIAEENR